MSIDLFERYNELPLEVQDVLRKYSDWDATYEECAALLSDMNSVGFTFDYYLDAEPYYLRRIVRVGEYYTLIGLATFFTNEGCNISDYNLIENGNEATIQHKNKAEVIKLLPIGKKENRILYRCLHTDIDNEIN